MKRLICIFFCLVLLCGSAFAADTTADSLSEKLDAFMEEHELDETNFSYSYFNTRTKESLHFNDTAYFPVGIVWTLPLHMFYYEQETKGAFEAPPEDPDWQFTIEGKTLEECRYYSIIQQNTQVALQMRDTLGDLAQYKILVNNRYGHTPEKNLPEEFFSDNTYTASFLMDCMEAVYRHPELYADMMQNYELMQTPYGFASFSNPYHVLHIYGKENGMICDVAEVAAPQNYLLVAFVSEDAGGDTVLAELNDIICDAIEQDKGIYTDETAKLNIRTDSDFIAESAGKDTQGVARRWVLIALLISSAVVILVVSIIRFIFRKREYDNY